MKQEHSRRFWVLVHVALAMVCLVTIVVWAAGFRRGSNHAQSKKPVTFENKTRSLAVTKAEIEPGGRTVRLAVLNTTEKDIDWFRISKTNHTESSNAHEDTYRN